MRFHIHFLFAVLAAFFMDACSSAPAKKDDMVMTKADSAAVSAVIADMPAPGKTVAPEQPRLPENIDAAHEAFLRAIAADLRGDKALSSEYWQQASGFDPYNRYLGFKNAEKMIAAGKDSLAFRQAVWSNAQPGKVTAAQLGMLARLYVREGVADSSRKYFRAALDSARNQDSGLLYDYSLFLEATQDKQELMRVYDLLLPHVNYIPSLFQRQLNLLVEFKKDSSIVELFAKAHEATGDKRMLAQLVEMKLFQKQYGEVYAIADTLTGTTEYDEDILFNVVLHYSSLSMDSTYFLLKKKFYDDGLQTPLVANFLGYFEHARGMDDSAKVHLKMGVQYEGKVSSFVVGAYHSLANIALVEENHDEAVRYAKAADSVSGGEEKKFLAKVYGYAHRYGDARALLDSLITAWDSWTPMKGITDSVSLRKIEAEVEMNRRSYRQIYGDVLSSEAINLERESNGDSASEKRIYELRVRALGYYEYIVAREPSNYDVLADIAMTLERMGKIDKAYPMMDSLLALNVLQGRPLASLLNYYGYSLIDRNGSPEDVARGYEMVLKSLEIREDEAVLDSKAWGLYRMGKFKEALEIMMSLKDPYLQKDHTYWEHLGAIQEALGMKEQATRSYRRLLEIMPKHPEALRFLKKKK